MKIEMGESIMYSWFEHVKECQIVQNNWRISPKWKLNNKTQLVNYFNQTLPLFSILFKKSISVESFLNQAECDVFGINFTDKGPSVHAGDVAFHSNGLNYNAHTVEKVIEKTVRTAMCILGYLNTDNADIYFATPFTGNKKYNQLNIQFNTLQTISDDLGFHFRYHFITNDEFKDEIVIPVCNVSNSVSNDNELWLRSYQLLSLFGENKTKKISKKVQQNINKNNVGQYARYKFTSFIASNNMSDAILNSLLDQKQSKKLFNVDYPVLVNINSNYPIARYYSPKSTIIKYKNQQYLLTNYWFENRNRSYLDKWFKDHMSK